MSRPGFSDQEFTIALERHSKYVGTAKVSLDQICFVPTLPDGIDSRRSEQLQEIFKHGQCARLDVRNHIPAVASHEAIERSLAFSEITWADLLNASFDKPPHLKFPNGQLKALHGRHRIQAASKALFPDDRWWTVDLYLDDIGEALRSTLLDEYANESSPTDGQIYRKVRQYEGEGNVYFRQRWYLRLSKTGRERLDQLDNPRNRALRAAFDKLLAIPGIWDRGMRISLLARIIASDCIDEIVHYLEQIYTTWLHIMGSDTKALCRVTDGDVQCLQLLRPHSLSDEFQLVQGRVLSGAAFGCFTETERISIAQRLSDFMGLIPSLHTFFEDFKIIESCSHCLKRLFSHVDYSIARTMGYMFQPPPITDSGQATFQVQIDAFNSKEIMVSPSKCFELAYWQIWLFVIRNYPNMPPDPRDEGDLLAKPNRVLANQWTVYQLALLSKNLGFQSPEINEILANDPDVQIARNALLKARDPFHYVYNAPPLHVLIGDIAENFKTASKLDNSSIKDMEYPARLGMRCGMPQSRTHSQDAHMVYLYSIHKQGLHLIGPVTTAFVLRWMIFAFFGSCDVISSATEKLSVPKTIDAEKEKRRENSDQQEPVAASFFTKSKRSKLGPVDSDSDSEDLPINAPIEEPIESIRELGVSVSEPTSVIFCIYKSLKAPLRFTENPIAIEKVDKAAARFTKGKEKLWVLCDKELSLVQPERCLEQIRRSGEYKCDVMKRSMYESLLAIKPAKDENDMLKF